MLLFFQPKLFAQLYLALCSTLLCSALHRLVSLYASIALLYLPTYLLLRLLHCYLFSFATPNACL